MFLAVLKNKNKIYLIRDDFYYYYNYLGITFYIKMMDGGWKSTSTVHHHPNGHLRVFIESIYCDDVRIINNIVFMVGVSKVYSTLTKMN